MLIPISELRCLGWLKCFHPLVMKTIATITLSRRIPKSENWVKSATLDRRVSQDWKSIFSICQTQDHLLEDDAFFRDSIWSEVVALK